MHAERIPSAGPPAAGRLSGLIRTRHMLAVCVVCGHDHVDGCGRRRETCPDCGATLNSFALYRGLQARR